MKTADYALASMIPHSADDIARRAITFRTVKGGAVLPSVARPHANRSGLERGFGDARAIRNHFNTYGTALTKTARRKLSRIAREHGETVRSIGELNR